MNRCISRLFPCSLSSKGREWTCCLSVMWFSAFNAAVELAGWMGDLWTASTALRCCRTPSLSQTDAPSDALRWVCLLISWFFSPILFHTLDKMGKVLSDSWSQSTVQVCERLNISSGVLPAQDRRLRPRVCAVVLQRVSEGDGFGHLQRSDSSPRRPHLQWHQLALPPDLHAGRYGKNQSL